MCHIDQLQKYFFFIGLANVAQTYYPVIGYPRTPPAATNVPCMFENPSVFEGPSLLVAMPISAHWTSNRAPLYLGVSESGPGLLTAGT